MEEMRNEKKQGFFDGNPKMIFVFGLVTGVALALAGVMLGGGDFSFGPEPIDRGSACPGELCESFYFEVADELDLNMKEFAVCFDEEEQISEVTTDQNRGTVDGVSGTPATVINGVALSGAVPYDMLKEAIDKALSGEEGDVEVMLQNILDDDHVLGDLTKAKVVMLEYSDFECPYCQNHHSSMVSAMQEYGDDIAWVYRHFPLSFHPEAEPASLASECAGVQGKFWEFSDEMFNR